MSHSTKNASAEFSKRNYFPLNYFQFYLFLFRSKLDCRFRFDASPSRRPPICSISWNSLWSPTMLRDENAISLEHKCFLQTLNSLKSSDETEMSMCGRVFDGVSARVYVEVNQVHHTTWKLIMILMTFSFTSTRAGEACSKFSLLLWNRRLFYSRQSSAHANKDAEKIRQWRERWIFCDSKKVFLRFLWNLKVIQGTQDTPRSYCLNAARDDKSEGLTKETSRKEAQSSEFSSLLQNSLFIVLAALRKNFYLSSSLAFSATSLRLFSISLLYDPISY